MLLVDSGSWYGKEGAHGVRSSFLSRRLSSTKNDQRNVLEAGSTKNLVTGASHFVTVRKRFQ